MSTQKGAYMAFLILAFFGLLIFQNKDNKPSFSLNKQSFSLNRNIFSPIGRENMKADDLGKIIKEGSMWNPKGYGSGEYLDNLPTIKAGAVIDNDSGEVIWSVNLKQKVAPASLTKLATIMTALDLAPLNETITVTDDASGQIPTKLGLKTGEKLSLSEASVASILTSANDAAEAIKDHFDQNLASNFMDLVNVKLKKIGAVNSHFETATGLDSDSHFSTVYDLAIIGHEAKKYPFNAQTAKKDYERLEASRNHPVFDLPNWNALLGTYPGVDGLKIGYTEDSGHSTIVTASRNNRNLIAIVVGAQSLEERENAAAVLLNYGFGKSGIESFPLDQIDLVKRFEDWRRQLAQGGR